MATNIWHRVNNTWVESKRLLTVDDLNNPTFRGNITLAGNRYVNSMSGVGGTAGYINIARITIWSSYQNVPIKITVSNRGRSLFTDLFISFRNDQSKDPALSKFIYLGDDINAYIKKVQVSVWDVYIQKTESYDTIGVMDYQKSPYMGSTSLEFKNIQENTLPDSSTKASRGYQKILYGSTAPNNGDGYDGDIYIQY